MTLYFTYILNTLHKSYFELEIPGLSLHFLPPKNGVFFNLYNSHVFFCFPTGGSSDPAVCLVCRVGSKFGLCDLVDDDEDPMTPQTSSTSRTLSQGLRRRCFNWMMNQIFTWGNGCFTKHPLKKWLFGVPGGYTTWIGHHSLSFCDNERHFRRGKGCSHCSLNW